MSQVLSTDRCTAREADPPACKVLKMLESTDSALSRRELSPHTSEPPDHICLNTAYVCYIELPGVEQTELKLLHPHYFSNFKVKH